MASDGNGEGKGAVAFKKVRLGSPPAFFKKCTVAQLRYALGRKDKSVDTDEIVFNGERISASRDKEKLVDLGLSTGDVIYIQFRVATGEEVVEEKEKGDGEGGEEVVDEEVEGRIASLAVAMVLKPSDEEGGVFGDGSSDEEEDSRRSGEREADLGQASSRGAGEGRKEEVGGEEEEGEEDEIEVRYSRSFAVPSTYAEHDDEEELELYAEEKEVGAGDDGVGGGWDDEEEEMELFSEGP